jgi:hypothetical protein
MILTTEQFATLDKASKEVTLSQKAVDRADYKCNNACTSEQLQKAEIARKKAIARLEAAYSAKLELEMAFFA